MDGINCDDEPDDREAGMKISDAGIVFIRQEEGESLKAYPDSRGILTIGVGHTGLVNGMPVVAGMYISREQSDALLRQDLVDAERQINRLVTVPLNQHQYDALCSLVFNIGTAAFARSTVLQKLNEHDYAAAAESILLWCRAGQHSRLLLPRRERERALFISTEP